MKERNIYFITKAEHIPVLDPDLFKRFKDAITSVDDATPLSALWGTWGASVLCWVLYYFIKKDGVDPESVTITMGDLRHKWDDVFGTEPGDMQAADVLSVDGATIK